MQSAVSMRIFFVIIIVLSFSGCRTKSGNIHEIKQITVRVKERQNVKLSLLSPDIRYIELDHKALLGDITILKTYQDRIYIYDDKGKQIVCFSMENGKRLFTIDQYGRGPGEILNVTNFCINPYRQSVEVMDWGNAKILRFDMNGQFLSEQKYSFSANYFEALDSTNYAVFANYLPNKSIDNQYSNLLFIDKNYTPVHEYLPFDPKLSNLSILYPTRMLPYGADWLLSLPFSYDIYKVSTKGVDTLYTLHFSGYEIKSSALDVFDGLDNKDSKESNYTRIQAQKKFLAQLGNVCYFVENFYESDQLIGFQFSFQKNTHLFLYSKKNKKNMVVFKLLHDDGSYFKGKFHCFDNNKLFASIEDHDHEEFKIMIMDLSGFY